RGSIDLAEGLVWAINKKHYSNTSPPVVFKDLVIVGSGVGDRLMYKNDPPGDVRAFNARTGKVARSFHTIPQPGEVGNDTGKYDSASRPNLVTSTGVGKKIDAVVQLTKQGFAYVFDRVTGVPVWPIEERPVPQSDVPGEETSPTQPFPTKPPAFTEQGATLDDA